MLGSLDCASCSAFTAEQRMCIQSNRQKLKRSSHVDDSLLDDLGGEVSVSGSTSKSDDSIQQTLSLLVTQISSLASRMDGIEKKKKYGKQSKGSSTSTSKKTKLAKKSRDEGSN